MALEKIPATVITGFLGAGKTTLIRHLLQNAKGRRIALVINEFGDIGVDREIIRGCGDEVCREEDVVELANGCICCTVADDFIPTMRKLLDRNRPPEHIVIETSGLALPQPLVRAFNWPEIKSRVTVDGVVTVVDAKALAEGRFADDEDAVARQRAADPNLDHENPIEELFEDQLNCADMIILNKTDLVDDHETDSLAGNLRSRARKGTKLVPAQHGVLDASALLGIASAAEDDMHNRISHHEMEGEVQHDHDDFVTFSVSLGVIADRRELVARIQDVIAEHDILRLKGFAAIEGAAGRLLIQAVGPRLNSYFDRPWRAGERRASEIVVIGLKGLDRAPIEARLKG
jgi:cobalamin biosynthesis protein CobW